jgi:hypothetical protein
MKKILVVLLILAVATGVFAQGEWSASASAKVEAEIDLNSLTDLQLTNLPGTTGDTGWKALTNYTEAVGSVGISYELDAFSAGIDFDQNGSIGVWGNVWNETDSGNVYEFQAGGKLIDLLVGDDNAFQLADTSRITELWGYYEMVGGIIHLEAAYKGPDVTWWTSDTTGGFNGNYINWDDAVMATATWAANAWAITSPFADGGAWGNTDGAHYLLTNIGIGGLEFGVRAPIFNEADDYPASGNYFTPRTNADDVRPDLVVEVLKGMTIGAKFDMFPIVAAMQLHVKNYGVYFGGTFELGQLTAGLSFTGELNTPEEDLKLMNAGLSVNYTTDMFGGGLNGKFESAKITDTNIVYSLTTIGVEPHFFINAIPTHLQFGLKAGFYFLTPAVDVDKAPMETAWAVEPALYWNFLGDGANDDPGTGFVFKYRINSGLFAGEDNVGSENKLTLSFRWAL